jgi:hypothetical protein
MEDLRHNINPNDLTEMHKLTDPEPALKVGETVEYDEEYSVAIPSLERFKKYLDRFYEYKLIKGREQPLDFPLYKITGIKSA